MSQVLLTSRDVSKTVQKIMGAEAFLTVVNGESDDAVADLKIRLIEKFCDHASILGRHARNDLRLMADIAKGFGWDDVAEACKAVIRDYGW